MTEDKQQDDRDDGMVGRMRRLVEYEHRSKSLQQDVTSLRMQVDNLRKDNDRLESQVMVQMAKNETLKWVIQNLKR